MERETTKVTTPVGKVQVELNSWLTGGEKMAMVKVETKDSIDFMLKTIVVSPDIETLKALHGKDFDFLLQEMNKVAEASSWTDEKKE